MTTKKSCLVIGGAGFVGSALAAEALQQGWAVTAVDRAGYRAQIGGAFDLVINANGNASRFRANREPLFDLEASVASVQRSLQEFPGGHYVLISTVDVYNDPTRFETTTEETPIGLEQLTTYSFHKRLAELLVQRQRASWQIFRLAQMVGPGLNKGPIYDLLHGGPLWVGQESQFPFINTRSVARTVLELVGRGPRNAVFNVCGRGSVVLREVIALLPLALRRVQHAASEQQQYCINTDKTHRYCALRESADEIREFLSGEHMRPQSRS